MAGHEVMLGFAWLKGVLSGDSQLASDAPGGVYRALAPPDSSTPFVIMAHQSGSDVITMNAFRLMTSALYQVKACGPVSVMDQIVAAAERIDQLIGLASGTVTGGVILACYREQPIVVDEGPINGQVFTNIGGLYRIQIEQTP